MSASPWMIVWIILAIIAIISIIAYIVKGFFGSSEESMPSDLDIPVVGGYRRWKRAMRKIRK